jgi:hypothetical protein
MDEIDWSEVDSGPRGYIPRTIDQWNSGNGNMINSRSIPKEEYLNWLAYYDEGEKFTLETFERYIYDLKSKDELDHCWVNVQIRPSSVERLRLYMRNKGENVEQAVEEAISRLKPDDYDLEHCWVRVHPTLAERLRRYIQKTGVTIERAVEKAIYLLDR